MIKNHLKNFQISLPKIKKNRKILNRTAKPQNHTQILKYFAIKNFLESLPNFKKNRILLIDTQNSEIIH